MTRGSKVKGKAKPTVKKKKSNAGAKCKYDATDFPMLAEFYARKGLTDKQIAENLGIAQVTFYDYINKYPKFANALKEGRRPVNFQVENALLKRALGYKYTEVTREEIQPRGAEPVVKHKVVEKHVSPSPVAIFFWLTNRLPEDWKHRQTLEHTGKGGGAIEITQKDIDTSTLSDAHKKMLLELTTKAVKK